MLSSNHLTSDVPVDQKSRLVIDHIDVNNFKSYLGKHTIGPFHRSFTSIIGPNGSGKSNVIDALMFVLGSRARRLRQNKLGELVYNAEEGSDKVEACTVDIYFALFDDYTEQVQYYN